MKKSLLVILAVVITWLSINLLSWIYLGYQFQRLSTSNLNHTTTAINNIATWHKYYPYLSLGTCQLPYAHDIYQLTGSLTTTATTGQQLIQHITPLAQQSLNGQTIEQDQISHTLTLLSDLKDQLQHLNIHLNQPEISQLATLSNQQSKLTQIQHQLDNIIYQLNILNLHPDAIYALLGYDSPQHVVVLLQNNMELWPTGGYMGSYASFWIDQGAIKDLSVQSIDVPNGQIKGYVEAPEPISTYTHDGGTPGWRLRESNWNPDFPAGFKTIDWFFTQGGVEPIDMLVGTNLIPIIDLISHTQGLNLPDYNLILTADNFYAQTQQHTSHDFFPGSTQKADFLGYTARQLLFQLSNQPEVYLPALAQAMHQGLSNNQVILTSTQPEVAILLNSLNWDGAIDPVECTANSTTCLADYLHVNEANLGINKTNCCIDRQFNQDITINPDNSITHQLSLTFINHNPPKPNPPEQWGGGYQAYIRLYIPQQSQLHNIIDSNNQSITESEITQETIKDKRVIGFPILVPGEQQDTYTITYTIDSSENIPDPEVYQLHLHKQPGISSIPWQLTINNQDSYSLNLNQDIHIDFSLK